MKKVGLRQKADLQRFCREGGECRWASGMCRVSTWATRSRRTR